jgi:hypothetical protein
MKYSVVGLLAALPLVAWGQVTVGPALSGTTTVIDNSAGSHTDPHVSANLCSYSNSDNSAFTVRYYDFSTAADAAVPNPDTTQFQDFLSDVSGTSILFTRASASASGIYTYVEGAASATEVDPTPGAFRHGGQIGSNTIAWQELASSGAGWNIYAYDIPSATATALTTDSVKNVDPAVSPDGTAITWMKCQTPFSPCDIWTATGGGSTWTSHQITNGNGDCSHPDSNGQVVVYSCQRTISGSLSNNVYWQPVAGGAEQTLNTTGSQINPAIAGQLMAFDGETSGGTNHNIYVYDLSSSTLYQITNSTDDEQLTDISEDSTGLVRVVWQVGAGTEVDAFSFKLATSCGCTCDDGDGDGDGDGHGNGHWGHDTFWRNHHHGGNCDCGGDGQGQGHGHGWRDPDDHGSHGDGCGHGHGGGGGGGGTCSSADLGLAPTAALTTSSNASQIQSIAGQPVSAQQVEVGASSSQLTAERGVGCASVPGGLLATFAGLIALTLLGRARPSAVRVRRDR